MPVEIIQTIPGKQIKPPITVTVTSRLGISRAAAGAVGSVSTTPPPPEPPSGYKTTYPKIFQRATTSNFVTYSGYNDPAWAANVAQADAILIGAGYTSNVSLIASQVKANNSNIVIFWYTNVQAVHDGSQFSEQQFLLDKLLAETGPTGNGGTWTPNDWLARDTGGNRQRPFPTSWGTNFTNFVTPDSGGQKYHDWYADQAVSIFGDSNVDGFHSDVVNWRPASGVFGTDWNRDGSYGTGEAGDDLDPARWNEYRQGHTDYQNAVLAQRPGTAWQANANFTTNVPFSNIANFFDQLPEYHQKWEGMMLEFLFHHDVTNTSGSEGQGGSWTRAMALYREGMRTLIGPKILQFECLAPETNYSFMRYGLGSCLLDDGYFNFRVVPEKNEMIWFDEYDLAGTSTTSWLGTPVDSPPTSPWSNGVFKREFTNGLVLVNPRTNGQQTVNPTVLGSWKFINGTQDTTVNNGQNITGGITIEDRGGRILQRQ